MFVQLRGHRGDEVLERRPREGRPKLLQRFDRARVFSSDGTARLLTLLG